MQFVKQLVRVFFLTFLLFNPLAYAEDPPYTGVWAGNIGGHKVQVCFATSDAQYFYVTKKKGIVLQRPEKSKNWQYWEEYSHGTKKTFDRAAAVWQFDNISSETISGTWTDNKTHEALSISLKKISDAKQLGSQSEPYYECGDQFFMPITNAIQYKYKQVSFNNRLLRVINTPAGIAFEYPQKLKNSKRINAFITQWLKTQAIEAYSCEMNGGSGWNRELTSMLWNKDWLVLSDTLPDTYCGGAHSFWSADFYTFDLKTGKKVDTTTWIKNWDMASASPEYDEFDRREVTGLRALAESPNQHWDECSEHLNSMYLSAPYPTSSGLSFRASFSHAVRSCENTINISYKQLMPYLSPAGLKAVLLLGGK